MKYVRRLPTLPMRVLVASRHDPASMNMRDRLVELGHWETTNRKFRGAPMLSQSEAILVEVEGPTVTDEQLDFDLKSTGLPIRDVWFLSKHRAESGTPSLTVHPIGNHGEAKFGGQPETLSPAPARDMGALLRRMRHHAREAGLPHAVTYESTHHGPSMTRPSLFVEIGSDDQWYRDPSGAKALAAAIEDVLAGGETGGGIDGPVLVGVGGGHYVPRHTDKALAGEADFGHFLPSHFVDDEHGKQRLARAVAATPHCDGVYVHRKGLKGAQRQAVLRWCEELGFAVVSPGSDD